jgi:hypothetical protein
VFIKRESLSAFGTDRVWICGKCYLWLFSWLVILFILPCDIFVSETMSLSLLFENIPFQSLNNSLTNYVMLFRHDFLRILYGGYRLISIAGLCHISSKNITLRDFCKGKKPMAKFFSLKNLILFFNHSLVSYGCVIKLRQLFSKDAFTGISVDVFCQFCID